MSNRRRLVGRKLGSELKDNAGKPSSKKRERRLVKYEELPEYLKDNEYILDHYRCEWPLKDAFLSLFSWHNETLNVWTHFLGFLLFLGMTAMSIVDRPTFEGYFASFFSVCSESFVELWIRSSAGMAFPHRTMKNVNASQIIFQDSDFKDIPHPSFLQADSESDLDVIPTWPWFVFLGGAMGCLICSSLSHLFACHSKRANLFFWRLDYAGISLMIVCSFFGPVYYAFFCNPISRVFYLSSITILGTLAIATLLVPAFSSPDYRSFRASIFLAMGFSGVFPAAHAVVLHFDDPQIISLLGYELLMGVLYTIGAGFYVSRIPEKWRPGAFDIAGHSHQIFHVFVIAGAFTHCAAVLGIMDWRRGLSTCVLS